LFHVLVFGDSCAEVASRRGGGQSGSDLWPSKLLDSAAQFPNSGRPMGKHDNRTSMKMRRRKAQKKLKARIKKHRAEKKAARPGGGKAAKKPRSTPAPAPAKE
jgi:hypothetical protein